MKKISVFAGLGSDMLFCDEIRDQAFQDIRRPQGQLLLNACHKAFVEVISREAEYLKSSTGIDLDDFKLAQDLLEPHHRYRTHPAVQNATLVIIQSLRYLTYQGEAQSRAIPSTLATSGFCIGLLTAVAVATSAGVLDFMSRAEQCFRAAVLIGFASYRMRKNVTLVPSRSPWSVVAVNISHKELLDGLASYQSQSQNSPSIFISAINSATCYTISGEGSDLQRFIETKLPEETSTRPTNIYSLYHEEVHGLNGITYVMEASERHGLQFPSRKSLHVPLLSTVDGSRLTRSNGDDASADLLHEILKMILAHPTDWVAVQDSMVSIARDEKSASDRSSVAIWNYGPGYGALTSHDSDNLDFEVHDVSHPPAANKAGQDDIAIVGIGIDLPGAPDLDSLWQNIMNGINSCSEIPSDRFHIEDYYTNSDSKPVNESRSLSTKFGNFLEDPFLFDNELFDISPREAASIDPQQRLMLQTVSRALESAGYVADSTPSFSRETFGCFVGSATLDYVDNLPNSIDIYYSPGTLRAFISGRVSYAFKWSGPCMTVDTACSSSLSALYQAARSLAAGDCRAAVAGGVNVITSPDMYLGLDKAHFLSPTGQCKAFDQAADGYCRSEGCASFVLKRLSDAERENDRIFGVIRGIAVNQSGLASSITHPHAPTQERLFKQLLKESDVDARAVSVVEAHGTGTQAGDPNELKSIRGVFAKGRQPGEKLHVTSIKSNIGHLEAASGGAALAKLLLMLKHKRIPPQALLTNLNSAIADLGADGTLISREPCDWSARSPRVALLNNFGAAGSNGALLLQEYEDPVVADDARSPVMYVFGCSARSEHLLEQTRKDLIAHLQTHKESIRISDICYTSTARRALQKCRLAVAASSVDELISKLGQAQMVQTPEVDRTAVFLFSGQGAQYAGMGKGLMEWLPTFKSTVLECHELLTGWGFPSCLEVIQPDEGSHLDMHDHKTTRTLQLGVFVLEVALAKALMSLGLKPSLVAGHSLGEFAALVVAEVLDLESALWFVAERGRLIVERCDLMATSMLAVNMSAATVRQKLLSRAEFKALEISCENSPNDCVIGGPVTALRQLKHRIKEDMGEKAVELDVAAAYHTAAMSPILADLKTAATRLIFSPPKLAIVSNVLGRLVHAGEKNVFGPDYVLEHCIRPVAFDSGIIDAHKRVDDIDAARWIEIGPHPLLLPMVAQHGARERSATLMKNKPADQTMAEMFVALYLDDRNNKISWRRLFERLPSKPKLLDLPPAPMDKKRYMVPLPREKVEQNPGDSQFQSTPFSLLQRLIDHAEDGVVIFETPLQALATLIQGHLVCGAALCPASVYTEMALAAITATDDSGTESTSFKLSGVAFHQPLLYQEGSAVVLRISLFKGKSSGDESRFEISSSATPTSEAKIHCSGKVRPQPASRASTKLKSTEQALCRRKTTFQSGQQQSFSSTIMYTKIFNRVVEYSTMYQAVKTIHLDDRLEEIFAVCQLPDTTTNDQYAGQPILLDAILHVAGFAANLNVDNASVCICNHVRSTTILRKDIAPRQVFDVHCSNFPSPDDADCVIADAHAVDENGGIIAVIKGMEFKRTKLAKLRAVFESASESSPQVQSKHKSISRSPARKFEQHEESGNATRQAASTSRSPSPDVSTAAPSRNAVVSILSEATGVDSATITPQTELSSMGVDSIMLFELDKKLEQALGERLPVSELSACKTVEDMEALVGTSPSQSATGNGSRAASRPGRSAGTGD